MKKKKTALSLRRSSSVSKKPTKLISRNPKKRAIKKRIRSNQPAHKRFILHPITVLVILCISVFIISWTYKAVADYYSITATVEASSLGQGAYITNPTNNEVFQVQTINVSGTCPSGSYVNLYRNNIFSGTAWCLSNTFNITTSLFVGTNDLRAQDYNVTNEPGPATPIVSVTYAPPSVVITNPGSSQHPRTTQPSITPSNPSGNSQPSNNPAPLFLSSDFHYQAFTVGSSYKWTLQAEGGVAPYHVTVNWGDGKVSKIYLASDPSFTISHYYTEPGYYVIKVTVTDADGNTSLLQLAALIRNVGASGIFNPSLNSCQGSSSVNNCSVSGSSGGLSQLLSNIPQWLYLAWPSLLIVLLMLASFYLGEKQQYYGILRKKRV